MLTRTSVSLNLQLLFAAALLVLVPLAFSQTLENSTLSESSLEGAAISAEPVCRILTADASKPGQRVCDSAERWAAFDQRFATRLVANTSATGEEYVVDIENETCRLYKQANGYLHRKVCKNAEEWAALDQAETPHIPGLLQQGFEISPTPATGYSPGHPPCCPVTAC